MYMPWLSSVWGVWSECISKGLKGGEKCKMAELGKDSKEGSSLLVKCSVFVFIKKLRLLDKICRFIS